MGPVTGLVGERLGHHGRQQPLFLGVMLGHVAEEGQTVAGGQRVGVFEVELVLPVGVLVIERIEVPAEIVDATRDLVEPLEIVEERPQIVAGLGQLVVRIGHGERAVAVLAQHEHFAFDAKIEAEAQFGGLGQHVLQRHPGVERIGLALEGVIGRHPGKLGLPRQLDGAVKIGH